MKIKIILSFTVIILLSGCLQSLHPFYTKDVLINYDMITGKWRDAEENVWEFSSDPDGSGYKLDFKEDRREINLTANIFMINGRIFMDLFVKPDFENRINYLYNFTLIPVHLLVNIELSGDILKLNFIDADFIKEYIKTMKDKIKFEESDTIYNFIITDNSQKIVEFLKTIKYDEDKFLLFQELKKR